MINMKRSIKLLLIVTILSASLKAQEHGPSFITIRGDIKTPVKIYDNQMLTMDRLTVQLTGRDGTARNYTGVSVSNLLKLAKLPQGKELRGENLSMYVMVKSADGYQLVFSLPEFDSSFHGRTIILADRLEGGLLPVKEGPFRLIVPNEKVGARSSFQVTEFIVRYGKD